MEEDLRGLEGALKSAHAARDSAYRAAGALPAQKPQPWISPTLGASPPAYFLSKPASALIRSLLTSKCQACTGLTSVCSCTGAASASAEADAAQAALRAEALSPVEQQELGRRRCWLAHYWGSAASLGAPRANFVPILQPWDFVPYKQLHV